jgi:Ca2+-binding EF-hand superfamily protein
LREFRRASLVSALNLSKSTAIGALWMQEDLAHTVAQAFVQFDTGCKGYLTRHELRVAHVAVLGHSPSQVELDAMLPKRTDGAAAADDGR